MPLLEGLRLRHAHADDLPRIAEMRHAAGWPVNDWALRAVLQPPHSLCLVAVDASDRVLGVGSGISYGAFSFVGNMIVDRSVRRRGVGAAILVAVMDFLAERGSTRLELFATDEGRPLYARHGFEPIEAGTSAVLRRDARLPGVANVALNDATDASVDELAGYDAPRFGGDRRPLLAMMLADVDRPVIVARQEGRIVGWGWMRPDAERLGPLTADSPDVAMAIVREALARMPEAPSLRLTMPPANQAGIEALQGVGATMEESGGRMARGPDVPRRDETIYGHAAGALG
jgi:GNAT superfamily N-acetyltransferase